MSFDSLEPGPQERAYRAAEKAVKSEGIVAVCLCCGHAMSQHWYVANGQERKCIREGCCCTKPIEGHLSK